MTPTFFDMMAMAKKAEDHQSMALESTVVYDETTEEFTVAQEGFFRDSKTPPKMIKRGDTDLVKYMTLQGKENMVMCIPNEKWSKEFLVRNDRVLSEFIKQGPDFVRKYNDYLKRGLQLWKEIKANVSSASMDSNFEKYTEAMAPLNKIFADLSAINRNFSGWKGDPTDVTDQFRNKMIPLLTDFQKISEEVTAEFYEVKGAYYQKSTLSRVFKYKKSVFNNMSHGIGELTLFAGDLWVYISRGCV